MSVDDLRAEFSRLAGTVVPDPDPYERLMSRRRKRLRHRIAATVAATAAVAVAAVAAPLALQAASQPSPPEGYPVESEWARRLLDSPTRGNMNEQFVAAATEAFDRAYERDGLPEVKVLFANETAEMVQVVVAFHSATRAGAVSVAAAPGTTAAGLARSRIVTTEPVTPFLVTQSELDAVRGAVVGLAPQGCEVAASVHANIGFGGSYERVYAPVPGGDYAINRTDAPAQLWRVTCDGKVREIRPARRFHDVTGNNYSLLGPGKGSGDPATVEAAAMIYRTLTVTTGVGDKPTILWGGNLPGAAAPAAVLGPPAGPGPVILHIGESRRSMIAMEPRGSAVLPVTPQMRAAADSHWSLTSTGITDGTIIAVRVPERDGHRATLSGNVLVIAEAEGERAQALDGNGVVIASTDLTGGFGVLAFDHGAAQRILVGKSELVLNERSPQLYGDQLIYDWS